MLHLYRVAQLCICAAGGGWREPIGHRVAPTPLARGALSGADLLLMDELDRLLNDTTRAAWQDWLCGTEANVMYASDDPDLQQLADARWERVEEGSSSGPRVTHCTQATRRAGGDRLCSP